MVGFVRVEFPSAGGGLEETDGLFFSYDDVATYLPPQLHRAPASPDRSPSAVSPNRKPHLTARPHAGSAGRRNASPAALDLDRVRDFPDAPGTDRQGIR